MSEVAPPLLRWKPTAAFIRNRSLPQSAWNQRTPKHMNIWAGERMMFNIRTTHERQYEWTKSKVDALNSECLHLWNTHFADIFDTHACSLNVNITTVHNSPLKQLRHNSCNAITGFVCLLTDDLFWHFLTVNRSANQCTTLLWIVCCRWTTRSPQFHGPRLPEQEKKRSPILDWG